MAFKYNKALQVPLLDCSFGGLLIGTTLFLTGCLAWLPIQTETPSDHFDTEYVETHQGSTKEDIVEALGVPGGIFRSDGNTYYVYSATGDLRGVAGIVLAVPPFFIPFFTAKEKDEALHCLAPIFDEKGLLNGYRTTTGTEEVGGAVFLGFGPPAEFYLGNEETCVEALWNEEEIRQLEIVAQYKQPNALLETPLAFDEVDGVPLVAAADGEHTVHLWDVRSDCLLERSLSGHEARVTAIAFGRLDGMSVVITGTSAGRVRLWNARTGELLGKPLQAHEGRVTTVALGEVDGISTVLSGGEDRMVRMWNARTGQRVAELAIKGQPLAVDVASGVPLLVISNFDGAVQVWDVEANHVLGGPVIGYGSSVTAISLAEVGGKPTLVLGSEDGTVRLWDVRSSGKGWGYFLKGDEQAITAVAAREIDRVPMVVSVDEYETIRLWDARAGALWAKPRKCLYTFDTQGEVPERRTLYYLMDVHERKKLYEESGLRPNAEAGNADAQWQAYKVLGNTSEGYKWLCRAADHGYTAAQSELGFLYASGIQGFTQNYTKAFVWYRLAGSGPLKKDVDKALNFRKKRARCGNVDAQACHVAKETALLMNILRDQGIARAEQLLQQWQPGQCERDVIPEVSGN